ncbi:MAG: sugar ABC transporter permease [Chloroflexota bacterium]
MAQDAVPVAIQNPTGAVTTQVTHRGRFERWAFLAPAVLFQLSWGWYPMVVAFILSFTDARPRGPISITGLESYTRIWNDPLTWQAFQVTAIYAVMSIVLTFMIPIFVAILLMEMKPKTMRWMMLLWFLPLSGISTTILWRYLYNGQYGLLQYLATNVLGLPPQPFLNSGDQVLFWLVFPGILLFGPGLIYMAGLQGIPQSYYEAAEVEGAGFFRKIWTISLPRLRPIISMTLTFAIIGSLQAFDWPQIMTGGQPGGASRTVVMYLYSLLGNLRYADATALALILFAVIMGITIAFRTFFREDPDA